MRVSDGWTYDPLFHAFSSGLRLKCLKVVDGNRRDIDVAGSTRSARVIEVLARPISVNSAPPWLRSGHGPRFVETALLRWLATANIEAALFDSGTAWPSVIGESFDWKLRDE